MSTKIIKAWINGAVQEIEVEDIVSPEQGLSYEDRLGVLEARPTTSHTIKYINLLSNAWIGESSPYSQVVEIEGITENSQVDITPDADQLEIFRNKDLGFVAENEDGVVTVYSIGDMPQNDYTVQVTITEVAR